MKIVMFYHSLISDWNHGNAHFLRGVVSELTSRGHQVEVYEEEENWSLSNLIKSNGKNSIVDFLDYYPQLSSSFYDLKSLDYDAVLQDADLVMVHEWSSPELVRKIGEAKKRHGFTLLFHDTHHRAVTEKQEMNMYDLSNYDGVLAFGEVISEIYRTEKWADKVWTWHEAADTNIFFPRNSEYEGDIVWIGNWGDDERSGEIFEYLIEPVKELKLKAKVYGVRYPKKALDALEDAGIEYGGWIPNYKVPEIFSKFRMTLHIPRGPYVEKLPGIPTIRPFEAMACGIPLISTPWNDSENLFTPGRDYMIAKDGVEMRQNMMTLINSTLSEVLKSRGEKVIREKHTCSHRVDQLEKILIELGVMEEKSFSGRKEELDEV